MTLGQVGIAPLGEEALVRKLNSYHMATNTSPPSRERTYAFIGGESDNPMPTLYPIPPGYGNHKETRMRSCGSPRRHETHPAQRQLRGTRALTRTPPVRTNSGIPGRGRQSATPPRSAEPRSAKTGEADGASKREKERRRSQAHTSPPLWYRQLHEATAKQQIQSTNLPRPTLPANPCLNRRHHTKAHSTKASSHRSIASRRGERSSETRSRVDSKDRLERRETAEKQKGEHRRFPDTGQRDRRRRRKEAKTRSEL
ncbi:hypothetical protein Bca101_065838 [Brassica carinata]